MQPKQIDVSCPCCDTRLTIDVLTRSVLRHAPKEQLDDAGKVVLDESRWDAAADKVRGRESAGDDKFDSALGKELSRSKDLDDLFEKAKRKAKEDPEDQG